MAAILSKKINAFIDALYAKFTGNADNVGSASLPYLEYICILSQTGTSVPTAQVIKNTLGGDVTWIRDDVGSYSGLLPGSFPVGRTYAIPFGIRSNNTFFPICIFSPTSAAYYNVVPGGTDGYCQVNITSDLNFTAMELSATGSTVYVEIRIYP